MEFFVSHNESVRESVVPVQKSVVPVQESFAPVRESAVPVQDLNARMWEFFGSASSLFGEGPQLNEGWNLLPRNMCWETRGMLGWNA